MSTLVQVITLIEDLISKIETIGFGSDTDEVTHNGITRPSVAKSIKDNYAAIQAAVQGIKSFETLTDLNNYTPTADADGHYPLTRVWKDTTALNNGLYGWNGSAWVKSEYDIPTKIEEINALFGEVKNDVRNIDNLYNLESTPSVIGMKMELGTNTTTGGSTYIDSQPLTNGYGYGLLSSVNIYCAVGSSSDVDILLIDVNFETDTATLVKKVASEVLNSGENNISFDPIVVKDSYRVGIRKQSGDAAEFSRYQYGTMYSCAELTEPRSITEIGSHLVMSYGLQIPSGDSNGNLKKFGKLSFFGSAALGTKGRLYITREVIEINGSIKTISIDLDGTGDFSFVYLSKNQDGTYKIRDCITLASPGAGIQDINLPYPIKVEKGGTVGIIPLGASVTYDGAGMYSRYDDEIRSDINLDLGELEFAGASINLSWYQVVDIDEFQLINDRSHLNVTSRYFSTFRGQTLPSGLTASGWTVNDGLVSPASGSLTTSVDIDEQIANINKFLSVSATINEPDCIFGLASAVSSHTGFNLLYSGSAGGSTSKLLIEKRSSSTTRGTLLSEVDIPWTVEAGDTVRIKWQRFDTDVLCTLTDSSGKGNVDIHWNGPRSNNNSNPIGNDVLRVIYISGSGSAGDVVINAMDCGSYSPLKPDVLVVGDSLVEARHLQHYDKGSFHRLLRNQGIETAVAAVGGAVTPTVLTYLQNELAHVSPKYVIWEPGVNNTTLSGYQSDTETAVSTIRAAGGIPVVCTIPPRSDRQEYINSANAWLLSRPSSLGDIYILDVAAAVTVNGDRVTFDSSMDEGDGLHWNQAGHTAVFNRIGNDLPFLTGF